MSSQIINKIRLLFFALFTCVLFSNFVIDSANAQCTGAGICGSNNITCGCTQPGSCTQSGAQCGAMPNLGICQCTNECNTTYVVSPDHFTCPYNGTCTTPCLQCLGGGSHCSGSAPPPQPQPPSCGVGSNVADTCTPTRNGESRLRGRYYNRWLSTPELKYIRYDQPFHYPETSTWNNPFLIGETYLICSDWSRVVWDGDIRAPSSGNYTFRYSVRDAGTVDVWDMGYVWVNDRLLVSPSNSARVSGTNIRRGQGTIYLTAGWHKINIQLDFRATGLNKVTHLEWTTPYNSSFHVVPYSYGGYNTLRPCSVPTCQVGGPTTLATNTSAQYRALPGYSSSDPRRPGNQGAVYSSPSSAQSWTTLAAQTSFPRTGTFTCPSTAGTHYVVCNSYNTRTGTGCTGNPWMTFNSVTEYGNINYNGWNFYDCGPYDRLTVNCVAPTPVPIATPTPTPYLQGYSRNPGGVAQNVTYFKYWTYTSATGWVEANIGASPANYYITHTTAPASSRGVLACWNPTQLVPLGVTPYNVPPAPTGRVSGLYTETATRTCQMAYWPNWGWTGTAESNRRYAIFVFATPTPTAIPAAGVPVLSAPGVCETYGGFVSGRTNLSWTRPAGTNSFELRYCTGSTCTPSTGTILVNGTDVLTYTHQGLDNLVAYRYQVRARIGTGAWSAWSTPITANTPDCATFLTVTQACSSGSASTNSSWTPQRGISNYQLMYCLGSTCTPSAGTQVVYGPNTTVNQTLGAVHGNVYRYTVRALTSGNWSNVVSVTINCPPPAIPTPTRTPTPAPSPTPIPGAPLLSNAQVCELNGGLQSGRSNLSWTRPSGTNSFELRFCTGSTCTPSAGTILVNGTDTLSYTHQGLDNLSTYRYQVRARVGTGTWSGWSNTVDHTPNCATTLSVSQSCSAGSASTTSSWTPALRGISNYQLMHCLGSTCAPSAGTQVYYGSNTTVTQTLGAAHGNVYRYSVRALTSGAWSNIQSVTINCVGPSPTPVNTPTPGPTSTPIPTSTPVASPTPTSAPATPTPYIAGYSVGDGGLPEIVDQFRHDELSGVWTTVGTSLNNVSSYESPSVSSNQRGVAACWVTGSLVSLGVTPAPASSATTGTVYADGALSCQRVYWPNWSYDGSLNSNRRMATFVFVTPTPTDIPPTPTPAYQVGGFVRLRTHATDSSCTERTTEAPLDEVWTLGGNMSINTSPLQNTSVDGTDGSYSFSEVPYNFIGAVQMTSAVPLGYELACPVGGSRGVSGLSTNVTDLNFYIREQRFPWWQVVGGDVAALGTTSPSIRSRIPGAYGGSKFIIVADGGLSQGVVVQTSSTAPSSGGGGITNSSNWWAASGMDASTREDYAYFRALILNGPNFTGQFSDPNNVGDVLLSGNGYFFYSINNGAGTMELENNYLIASGVNQVHIIDGDLEIKGNIVVESGGFVAFIVSGDLEIKKEVSSIHGVYVADGELKSMKDTVPNMDTPLDAQGTFAGWGTVRLERDLPDDITGPGERFTYRPDLLMNAPSVFRKNNYLWSELAP